jgi:hypothetical protein
MGGTSRGREITCGRGPELPAESYWGRSEEEERLSSGTWSFIDVESGIGPLSVHAPLRHAPPSLTRGRQTPRLRLL